MKKTLMKLGAAALLALIALVIAVVSTFAWYSASGTPEVGGIQLKIGGGGTIQIAADMTVVTEDGVLHYPGNFSDSLNFSQAASYDYLNDVVGLAPVSTADGVHWFFPTYYEEDTGKYAAQQGNLRPVSDFLMDDTYSYANMTTLPDDDTVSGSYVMLDFWVMAPMDCSLRVSYGDADSGSYAVSMPYPTKNEDGNYEMKSPDDALSAAVRVGFLADTRTQTDDSMSNYMASTFFDNTVTSLRGVYGDVGEAWDGYEPNFTIYEPNATYHSGEGSYVMTDNGLSYREYADGSYVKTQPVGYVDGQAQLVDVTEQTAVQTATQWLKDGDSTLLQQLFATYMLGESQDSDPKMLFSKFYSQYLGYRCDSYIEKGNFVKNASVLEQACDSKGVVTPDNMSRVQTAGATDDVVIVDLEHNVPQRIRMFVWIEGQDVDCANVLAKTALMINLELAGSSR